MSLSVFLVSPPSLPFFFPSREVVQEIWGVLTLGLWKIRICQFFLNPSVSLCMHFFEIKRICCAYSWSSQFVLWKRFKSSCSPTPLTLSLCFFWQIKWRCWWYFDSLVWVSGSVIKGPYVIYLMTDLKHIWHTTYVTYVRDHHVSRTRVTCFELACDMTAHARTHTNTHTHTHTHTH